jgi:3'-phosphoadenosine 5'-phosphosulfate (PAPS) 3'-phosphatase
MATEQTTLGGNREKVVVNRYKGNRNCDKCTGYKGNGEPKRCGNTAKFAILRKRTGMAEFYCRMHTRDLWKDMAGDSVRY